MYSSFHTQSLWQLRRDFFGVSERDLNILYKNKAVFKSESDAPNNSSQHTKTKFWCVTDSDPERSKVVWLAKELRSWLQMMNNQVQGSHNLIHICVNTTISYIIQYTYQGCTKRLSLLSFIYIFLFHRRRSKLVR